jgi:hypothetical protein
VTERRAPGTDIGLETDMGKAARREGDRPLPLRDYVRALDVLKGDGAGAAKLNGEQIGKIEAIVAEHQKAIEDFRAKMRQEGQQGGSREDVRGRMQEMRANMPRPTDAQNQIWQLLTPEQQKLAEPSLAAARKAADERRGEQYLERQRRDRGAGAEGQPRGEGRPDGMGDERPGPGAPGGREGMERGMRIMQRMRSLPPERRDQILQMLERELAKAEADAPKDGAPREPRTPRRGREGGRGGEN